MAIEMAREAGPFFSFVDFMSCITVAKQPCYGPLKIKPSLEVALTSTVDLENLHTNNS
jgi:hypothetical protein